VSAKQLALAKRVQDIMARENTMGTLEEALYQLNLENRKRRDLESKLFSVRLLRFFLERKLRKFQGESIE
jgi:hypothetical protein